MPSLSGRKVVIFNLPDDVSEEDLEELFDKYGRLTRVNIRNFPGGRSGMGKIMAFVDFQNEKDAELAVAENNDKEYRGNLLRVEYSRSEGNKGGGKRGRRDSRRRDSRRRPAPRRDSRRREDSRKREDRRDDRGKGRDESRKRDNSRRR